MTEETKTAKAESDEQAAFRRNVAAAKEMAQIEGHSLESAGKWLHAQCPGAFESETHAIEHIS